jgi:hypothetical protein
MLLLFLVLAVAGVTACGSGGSAESKSVDQLLAETFGSGKGITSGKLNASLDFTLAGVSGFDQPVAVKLYGPFEGRGKGKMPEFDLALNFSQGGQNVAAGAVSTGSKGYLRIRGQAYELPDEVFAQFRQGFLQAGKQSGGKQDTTLKALGIDPRRWLTGARKVGEATVGGARTVHISAGIAVDRFLADVNTLLGRAGDLGLTGLPKTQGLTAAQRAEIARSVRTARVDVYTGADDTILRRLVLNVSLSVPASARKAIGGLRDGKIFLDLGFADINRPQSINPPADAKPITDLAGGAGALLGGAPSDSGATPPQVGGVPDAYVRCVQAAAGDVAKVQKCAALLR